MMNEFTLHAGKMEEVLKQYTDNHFDSCVTDGPYGIGFMGKEWDTFKSEYKIDNWDYSSDPKIGRAQVAGKYDQSIEANRKFQQWFYERALDIYRVLKPGGYFISFCSPRTYHRMVCGIEDAGFEIRDQIFWVFASGFPKSSNQHGDWEGWGTALKPAHEPILVARKPLIGTVPQNLTEFGTGAMNINACRIPGEPWFYGNQPKLNGARYQPGQLTPTERHAENIHGGQDGRWPANLIHDGSDEVKALFPESKGQQGDLMNHSKDRESPNGIFGKMSAARNFEARGDSGSAARFFKSCQFDEEDIEFARMYYCAKTSRTDRNEGCEHLESGPLNWSSGDQNPGSFQSEGTDRSSPNNHPTVKPTDLMRYLIKLVTRPGGHVLDPFCGSGSTGKAAMLERMIFTGIDMDPHNIEISEARIRWAQKNRSNQTSLNL